MSYHDWRAEQRARDRAERAKLAPDKCVLTQHRWYNPGPQITLADLRRAIEAHGGNQTRFAVDVMGCTDGRQVRRWLARERMSAEQADKLRAYLDALSKPAKKTGAKISRKKSAR